MSPKNDLSLKYPEKIVHILSKSDLVSFTYANDAGDTQENLEALPASS